MYKSWIKCGAPNPPKHVLIVGFPGYGHFIPLITFAEKLSNYHYVTLAVSQSILPNLRKRGLLHTGCNIVGIEDGVPEGLAEDTVPNVWEYMWTVIQPSIANFIQNLPVKKTAGNNMRPVDVVIGDIFIAMGLAACEDKGIPYYLFCTCSAGPFRKFVYITEETPVDENAPMALEIRPASERPQPPVRPGTKRLALAMNQYLSTARGMILNSFRDLEAPFVEEFRRDPRMAHYEFWCVGPLMPVERHHHEGLDKQITDWLDTKSVREVLYISFGTVDVPNEKRIIELGKALVVLGRPFVFSLRSQQHGLLPESLQAGAADPFGPGNLGLVLPWVPQKTVLSHPDVGAFISHCGWNSSMEALWYGKPVIAWPIHGDQFVNANWLTEIGMCKIPPGAENVHDGFLNSIVIKQSLEEVMQPLGSYTAAAVKWSEKARTACEPGGSSYEEFVKLIDFEGRGVC